MSFCAVPDSLPPRATDAAALAQALIRCPSVTPHEGGALDLLQSVLQPLGFTCHRLVFDEGGTAVDNLYARLGHAGPNFCFAGHTDVVPPGTAEDWLHDPFSGVIDQGRLWGRGAADMKGAIAAFIAALADLLDDGVPPLSLSLLITGDEEGPAVNGTVKVLDWLAAKGERIDACIVGEPTNPEAIGDMIKIGRRGSLNAMLTVKGSQGHVAYPERAENPIPPLLRLLGALTAEPLDDGTAHFQPSNLEITSVDVGNETTNLIPARATARLNVRFNDRFSGEDLIAELRRRLDRCGHAYSLEARISGESFLTEPAGFVTALREAVAEETGMEPALSTGGGTSDARFIARHAPVVEFGLVGRTMHQVDEHVALADLERLTAIYRRFLARLAAEPTLIRQAAS